MRRGKGSCGSTSSTTNELLPHPCRGGFYRMLLLDGIPTYCQTYLPKQCLPTWPETAHLPGCRPAAPPTPPLSTARQWPPSWRPPDLPHIRPTRSILLATSILIASGNVLYRSTSGSQCDPIASNVSRRVTSYTACGTAASGRIRAREGRDDPKGRLPRVACACAYLSSSAAGLSWQQAAHGRAGGKSCGCDLPRVLQAADRQTDRDVGWTNLAHHTPTR